MAITRQEKCHKILKSKKQFPDWNLMDYDTSLRKNLFFYNTEIDDDFKKSAALGYWRKQGKDVTGLSRLNAGWFSTAGAVAHLVEREIDLDVKHLAFLDKKYIELCKVKASKEEQEVTKATPVITKEEVEDKELSKHIAELESGLDVALQVTEFSPKAYLLQHEVKPPVMKRIAEWFKRRHLKELREIEKDQQLQEGYSHLSKRQLKKYTEAVEAIIAACEVATALKRAARKSRARKEKAPSQVVKGVNYLKEFPDLGLKSIFPEKLVNTDEIWVFNVKVRRLFRYVALPGMKMTIKGTTIIGFDPEKSGGKIMRKPEVQLKGVESMTTRPLNKLYNEVRAVPSKPTGRINGDCILIKAF